MEYRILRSSRKTLSIQITPEGEVLVRCPNRMPKWQIQQFVDSKADWIDTHLQKIAVRPAAPKLTAQELKALANLAAEDLPKRVARFAPPGGCNLRPHHHPLPAYPLGQLLRQGKSEFQLPADADSGGGPGLCGGSRTVPPEANEPFPQILGGSSSCPAGLFQPQKVVERQRQCPDGPASGLTGSHFPVAYFPFLC